MDDCSDPKPPSTDLLGEPWRELKDNRGRRKLRFAPEVYEKVEAFKALNMTIEDIAIAVGISAPSLRKYFFPELAAGVARTKAKLMAKIMERAEEGSVPAIKLALQLLEKGEAQPPTTRAAPRPAAILPDKPGKKEALRLAANAGGEPEGWGKLLQ